MAVRFNKMFALPVIGFLAIAAFAYSPAQIVLHAAGGGAGGAAAAAISIPAATAPIAHPDSQNVATFAGGCFWSMTTTFESLKGVKDVTAGYIGGKGEESPSYQNYTERGFIEAVRVQDDPKVISYRELLDNYWRHTDPSDGGGQFVDRGPEYRPVLYFRDVAQKSAITAAIARLNASGRYDKPLAVEVAPDTTFYPAEDYHQHYAVKSPAAYAAYRGGSGREEVFEKYWGAARNEAVLKKTLTPLQYSVTQKDDTENAFKNTYWDNHKDGIYVDIVSNEPLFSSVDKFESGTGWPSFTRPLEPGNLREKSDHALIEERTEVRSREGNSHLGHVFDDGPEPTHLRYCMDSASLRFIPKEDLAKEGFSQDQKLFK